MVSAPKGLLLSIRGHPRSWICLSPSSISAHESVMFSGSDPTSRLYVYSRSWRSFLLQYMRAALWSALLLITITSGIGIFQTSIADEMTFQPLAAYNQDDRYFFPPNEAVRIHIVGWPYRFSSTYVMPRWMLSFVSAHVLYKVSKANLISYENLH